MAGRGTDIQLGGNFEMRLAEELAKNPDANVEDLTIQIKSEIARDKEIALAAGGLYVLGSERHESRRIDNQLRGRSGRQGDPGSSVFFVSFEDTVMRLFASDRVVKTLDKLGFKEGEMIESPMVTKSIENAQKRVEENNFGIRKRLVEYDDVMNAQRNGIYGRRQNALKGERIGTDIANMIYEVAQDIASTKDYAEVEEAVLKAYAMQMPFTPEEFAKLDRQSTADAIADAAMQAFARKKEKMAQFSFLMVLVPILGETFLEIVGGEFGASSVGALSLALGFVSAFLSGLFACKVMIALVKKAKLSWFALYCLIAAACIFIFA